MNTDTTPKARKPRQKKVKVGEAVDPIVVKPPPKETDFAIILIRLEDGRILAIGDKSKGDETMFRAVLNKNTASLFSQFSVDLAEDISAFIPEKHVFYITEIFI